MFNANCKETICMKYQSLFYGEKYKKKNSSFRHLLKQPRERLRLNFYDKNG